ncbi:MAG TPA: AgmX/PglI C-terminal domain-containing protein [Kofleriaceae bacterium]|nr:AgmX/PglI C-terminal domain-containing protein [Kofleriaceae bacterium]
MFGDSVVDVKHCMNPQSGKVTPRTWAMLGTGALCLLVSAVAFYVSVRTAAYNKAALDYWTHVANKPVHSFRPAMLSTGYDWLAFGGLALGLVTVVASLVRMRREKQDPFYRVGTAPDVHQALEGAPSPSFPLIAPKGDDFVFNFGVGMTGEAMIDGKSVPLAELAASGRAQPSTTAVGAFELPIPMKGRIRANIGKTSFLVSGVAKPAQQTAPLMQGLESRTLSYFAGSLGAHLALVLFLSYVPIDEGTASFDLASLEPTDIRSSSTEKTDFTPEKEEVADAGGGGPEASGRSMELDEGTAGTTKSNRIDSHMRMKQTAEEAQLARVQAIEEARQAGILGSSALASGAAFASLTAQSNISSGFDDADVYGAIFGAEGEGMGNFGYGRSGFGPGGGCSQPPCGIIGTPTGYGKIGLGKYPGSGWDGGLGGRPGMKRHTAAVPQPVVGQPNAVGGLDKTIIRRYIKRNVDKIAYCYEKQLLAHPGIEGTVSIQFFISPDGSVKSSNGAGFDGEVASCVAGVVSAIEFPRPDGGGGVQVNYPFTFHASGN